MATREEIKLPEYVKIMVYGLPGAGKTRFCGTAAEVGNTLLLNSRGNPLSIRNYDKKPDVITMEKMEDFNPAYYWLRAGQKPGDPYCQEFKLNPPYTNLIVDSITEVQRFSFDVVSGNKDVGPGDIPRQVEIQHFNRVLANMVRFAKLFFDLPMNVFLTSLEKEDKDESTGAYSYRPLIWGQSGTEIGGYAYMIIRVMAKTALTGFQIKVISDVVGKEVADNMNNVAIFKQSTQMVAKDQYGTGLAFMVDPSVPKLLDAIRTGGNLPNPKP